jgi:hypothetical protein
MTCVICGRKKGQMPLFLSIEKFIKNILLKKLEEIKIVLSLQPVSDIKFKVTETDIVKGT